MKMYDYTRPWITHVSVQRFDVYKTAEMVTEWRELYQKPIVVDEYEVELIDTWDMTVQKLPGCYEGDIRIELPEKQYMAVRMKSVLG